VLFDLYLSQLYNGTSSLNSLESDGTIPLEVHELSWLKQAERLGRINPDLTSAFSPVFNVSRVSDQNILISPIALEHEYLIDPDREKIDAAQSLDGTTTTLGTIFSEDILIVTSLFFYCITIKN
jgi:hypothetical protein